MAAYVKYVWSTGDLISASRLNNLETQYDSALTMVWPVLFPLGHIYIHTVNVNPGTFIGGTWTAFGSGQVLVGYDAGQVAFDAIEKTGGAMTHTLTVAEMPAHTHVQDAHTHVQDAHNHTQNAHAHTTTNVGSTEPVNGTPEDVGAMNDVGTITTNNTTAVNNAATAANQDTTATNQNEGGGTAHSNLMPYIVVHMWKRTA